MALKEKLEIKEVELRKTTCRYSLMRTRKLVRKTKERKTKKESLGSQEGVRDKEDSILLDQGKLRKINNGRKHGRQQEFDFREIKAYTRKVKKLVKNQREEECR